MPNLFKENNQELIKDDKKSLDAKKINTDVYHLESKKSKKGSSRWWWPTIILLVVIIMIGLGFLTKAVMAINSTNSQSGEKVSLIEQIKNLLSRPESQLLGEKEDRINILLAGIGGAGHEGAYLADTIIVASIKPSTQEVATISIPRDLYVDIPEFGWRKINNALAFGVMSDYPGGGEALLTETVEEVIGLTIHYYARIDFEGFRKVIDDLGGIKIYVENSFTDYQYPDYNYGYQTIYFTKGWELMDGERALQFVRSRHGNNGEGSDFARSKRQQKVIFAVKEKVLSLNTFLNPTGVLNALDDLGNHNKTNMQIWEILRLSKLVGNISQDNVITQVLETGENGLLKSDSTLDGAYILLPKAGDYSEIQYLAENIFDSNFLSDEGALIEIQNSTSETGLAQKTANYLESMNYNIAGIGNAAIEETLEKTTIYDLSGGTKPHTIIGLKEILNAEVSSNLPPFMTEGDLNYETLTAPANSANLNTNEDNIDILIVVGADRISDN